MTAAMGSGEAVSILQGLGDYQYENYPENMYKLRSYITGLDQSQWTQNLYWNWLYTCAHPPAPGSFHSVWP